MSEILLIIVVALSFGALLAVIRPFEPLDDIERRVRERELRERRERDPSGNY